jgi:hypothetical protein
MANAAKTEEFPLALMRKNTNPVAKKTDTMKNATNSIVVSIFVMIVDGLTSIPIDKKKNEEKIRLNGFIERVKTLPFGIEESRLPARNAPMAELRPMNDASILIKIPNVKEKRISVS